jgi:hypothetical protein
LLKRGGSIYKSGESGVVAGRGNGVVEELKGDWGDNIEVGNWKNLDANSKGGMMVETFVSLNRD